MNNIFWVICTSEDEGKTWRVYGVRPIGTQEEADQIPQILEILAEETGYLTGFWEVPFCPNPGDILEGVVLTLH